MQRETSVGVIGTNAIGSMVEHPDGLNWLRRFAVIWLGGAPLSADLARRSRDARLRLAPCYGATETAAW